VAPAACVDDLPALAVEDADSAPRRGSISAFMAYGEHLQQLAHLLSTVRLTDLPSLSWPPSGFGFLPFASGLFGFFWRIGSVSITPPRSLPLSLSMVCRFSSTRCRGPGIWMPCTTRRYGGKIWTTDVPTLEYMEEKHDNVWTPEAQVARQCCHQRVDIVSALNK
jgi:hypothetical protein